MSNTETKQEIEVFGNYNDSPRKKKSVADISLDFIVPLKLLTHWKKCSLVANFFGTYQSFSFKERKKITSILSTITNELLENAVKFTSNKNNLVTLSLRRYNDTISIQTINICEKAYITNIKEIVSSLEKNKAEDIFLSHIESSAKSKNKTSSKLGLVSIIKDYGAKIGIKIEPQEHLYNLHIKMTLSAKKLDSI
jgi:Uncharacterized protein conserved in bacteria